MSPVEESLSEIKTDLSLIKHRLDGIETDTEILNKQLQEANEQLTLYRHIISIMRWGGAGLLAIITLKWGDIPKLFGGA